MENYKTEGIKELAETIKKEGFRVFIAKNGEYGFYTDREGKRVCSFQYDILDIVFSGNYISTNSGSGWRIGTAIGFDEMLNAAAPRWAIGKDLNWRYATLKDQLDRYGKSSGFMEI